MDGVVLEIAQGSGEALAACEEVLVDAQDGRASRRVFFREVAFEPVTEMPFHGGRADALAPAYPAAVDAIEVLAEYRFPERLAGVLTRQDSRKALPELPPAIQALPLPTAYLQPTMPQSQVLVAHRPLIPPLASLPLTLAVRA